MAAPGFDAPGTESPGVLPAQFEQQSEAPRPVLPPGNPSGPRAVVVLMEFEVRRLGAGNV